MGEWSSKYHRGPATLHPQQNILFVADSAAQLLRSLRPNISPPRSKYNHYPICTGIAIHPTLSWIYYSDYFYDRVVVTNQDSALVRTFGRRGSDDGLFDGPKGLAIHPAQELLYVLDAGNYRVQVFDLEGVFLRKWSTRREGDDDIRNAPCDVAIHRHQDVVFVACFVSCVRAFQSDGTYLFTTGPRGFDRGQIIWGMRIAVHSTRNWLIVVETGPDRVQIFDTLGMFLCEWRCPQGRQHLSGVAVDEQLNHVHVVHSLGVDIFAMLGNQKKRKRREIQFSPDSEN